MELYLEFSYWIFQSKVWVILGFTLIIIDIFLGSFFILPIGVAAFLVSGLIFAQNQLWFGDFMFLKRGEVLQFLFRNIFHINRDNPINISTPDQGADEHK